MSGKGKLQIISSETILGDTYIPPGVLTFRTTTFEKKEDALNYLANEMYRHSAAMSDSVGVLNASAAKLRTQAHQLEKRRETLKSKGSNLRI